MWAQLRGARGAERRSSAHQLWSGCSRPGGPGFAFCGLDLPRGLDRGAPQPHPSAEGTQLLSPRCLRARVCCTAGAKGRPSGSWLCAHGRLAASWDYQLSKRTAYHLFDADHFSLENAQAWDMSGRIKRHVRCRRLRRRLRRVHGSLNPENITGELEVLSFGGEKSSAPLKGQQACPGSVAPEGLRREGQGTELAMSS